MQLDLWSGFPCLNRACGSAAPVFLRHQRMVAIRGIRQGLQNGVCLDVCPATSKFAAGNGRATAG